MTEKTNHNLPIHEMSTGVRVTVSAVNPATLTDIQMQIKNPPVPTRIGPDMGMEPILDHPDWLAGCEMKDLERASAMMDIIALFNVELVDGLPADNGWIKKLTMLHKMGRLDLSSFDLEDENDREFLYKKHIALATEDWTTLFKLSGVPTQIVAHMESGTTE